MGLNIFNNLCNRLKFFSIFIGYFDFESFFKSHYEFDSVQRICAKVVNELGVGCNLVGFYAELFDDDVPHLFFDVSVSHGVCN